MTRLEISAHKMNVTWYVSLYMYVSVIARAHMCYITCNFAARAHADDQNDTQILLIT